MRIFQYYLPVFFWCWNQVKAHKAAGKQRPLVIGMQAVQGCGKTTLVEQLQELFTHIDLQAASISVDDFYLPYEGQQQLIQVSCPSIRLYSGQISSIGEIIISHRMHYTCGLQGLLLYSFDDKPSISVMWPT